jgi:precorrin-6B methylase 2
MPNIELWIITISNDQSIREIATRLSAEGLTIKDILEEIGCITGSADIATADRLKKIKGVVDIAPDVEIQMGPPDAEESW